MLLSIKQNQIFTSPFPSTKIQYWFIKIHTYTSVMFLNNIVPSSLIHDTDHCMPRIGLLNWSRACHEIESLTSAKGATPSLDNKIYIGHVLTFLIHLFPVNNGNVFEFEGSGQCFCMEGCADAGGYQPRLYAVYPRTIQIWYTNWHPLTTL